MSISLQNSHLGRLRNYLTEPVIALNIWGIPLLKSSAGLGHTQENQSHSFMAALYVTKIPHFNPRQTWLVSVVGNKLAAHLNLPGIY